MAMYLHDIDEEKFNELAKDKIEDNKKVLSWLQKFVDKDDDRRFNFTLLNLGTLMKICAVAIELKTDEITDYFKLDKERTRNKKIEFILKELNQKINLRYEFNDDTEIVSFLYTFNGRAYLYIDKTSFIALLYEKDIDIETLENV